MKQLKLALLMLTICALALGSCKKDKEETGNSSFSAKIDGATKTSITAPTATLYSSENSIQIVGQFSTTSGISIMIENPRVATFDVNSDDVMIDYMATNDYSSTYSGVTGNVKVTSYTADRITGTFEFVGELNANSGNKKTISEGKFDAKIIKM